MVFPTGSSNSKVFIHERALCESNAVGCGTRIWAFAHIMTGAVVGKNCNICGHSFIESGAVIGNGVVIKNGVMVWNGVTIEDNVFIGPGTVFTNDKYPQNRNIVEVASRYEVESDWMAKTLVRQGASIGAGAVICPGITIGEYAMIGAGSVVTKNIPPHQMVAGNPAQEIS